MNDWILVLRKDNLKRGDLVGLRVKFRPETQNFPGEWIGFVSHVASFEFSVYVDFPFPHGTQIVDRGDLVKIEVGD